MRRMPKTLLMITVFAAIGAMVLPAGALPAFSTSPQSKTDPHPNHETQLWRIRPANDGSFDRIVFDERFSPSGFSVRYVHQVTDDASGNPIHVKGHHFLQVSITNASTSGAAGTPTNVHAKYTPLLPEVRQIKAAGDFEDVLSFGIGLRHHHGYRAFVMHNPDRFVIDVEH